MASIFRLCFRTLLWLGEKRRAGSFLAAVAGIACTSCLTGTAWASDQDENPLSFLEKSFRKIDFDVSGLHVYWKDRFRVESVEKAVRIQVGGIAQLDSGYIGADRELETAFPGLRGYHTDFRRLRLTTCTTLYDTIDIEFDIDFAQQQEIKDFWIGMGDLPVLGNVRAGHIKEPFSLEELTSNTNLTFMERGLPILAFSPGRDVGVLCQNTALDDRMTWSVGAFMVTGSFANLVNATDRLSHISGYALTGRITTLPWYGERGRRLMHAGFSFTYQDRDETSQDSRLTLSALPESDITNQRLISTPSFYCGGMYLIAPEFAVVLGPLSFQAEVVQVAVDAGGANNPDFWGGYVYASYFLTGEHRLYDREAGIFFQVTPKNNFQFLGSGWGAWELALRFSYADLNGGNIRGGREGNIAAGINWYIDPHFRLVVNYIHVDARDRTDPPLDSGTSCIYQARLQIAF